MATQNYILPVPQESAETLPAPATGLTDAGPGAVAPLPGLQRIR